MAELSGTHGIPQEEIVAVVQRVLRDGPECFGDLGAGVHFWADVWDAVHLEEIYVEIAAPSSLRVAPSADVHLDELVDELPEWTRVHMSTVAVESFAQTLQLLHHEGVLVAQDLFVARRQPVRAVPRSGQARGLDRQLAQRPDLPARRRAPRLRGDVEPFAYREGSNTAVLTARHRDTHRIALGTETATEDAGLAPAAA